MRVRENAKGSSNTCRLQRLGRRWGLIRPLDTTPLFPCGNYLGNPVQGHWPHLANPDTQSPSLAFGAGPTTIWQTRLTPDNENTRILMREQDEGGKPASTALRLCVAAASHSKSAGGAVGSRSPELHPVGAPLRQLGGSDRSNSRASRRLRLPSGYRFFCPPKTDNPARFTVKCHPGVHETWTVEIKFSPRRMRRD